MGHAPVLLLVFIAVAWGVWVVTPLLVAIGLQRAEDKQGAEAAPDDPLFRFTTPERLIQACCSAALLSGGVLAALLIALGIINVLILIPTMTVASILGYQIPRIWVNQQVRKRRRHFETRLVDLMMGLANGLRSGAALPQSLEVVARDIGGVVGEEFSLLLREYRLGVDLPDGLIKLCRRMPLEDLQLLATAVRVTIQAGGSLAEVLDKITGTIRERIEFQEKLRTMTAQGRFEAIAMALAPMAAFAILYIIDPSLMRPLATTPVGLSMLGVVVALEVVGFLFINRIVTVEV